VFVYTYAHLPMDFWMGWTLSNCSTMLTSIFKYISLSKCQF